MRRPTVFQRLLIGLGTAALLAGLVLFTQRGDRPALDHVVQVQIPTLDGQAERGRTLFVAHCASCHGQDAGGSENGPPLIHRFYHPSHHADRAFLFAVTKGVRAHHWRFGDMAPLPQVKPNDIPLIVRFVRLVQAHNGIF